MGMRDQTFVDLDQGGYDAGVHLVLTSIAALQYTQGGCGVQLLCTLQHSTYFIYVQLVIIKRVKALHNWIILDLDKI